MILISCVLNNEFRYFLPNGFAQPLIQHVENFSKEDEKVFFDGLNSIKLKCIKKEKFGDNFSIMWEAVDEINVENFVTPAAVSVPVSAPRKQQPQQQHRMKKSILRRLHNSFLMEKTHCMKQVRRNHEIVREDESNSPPKITAMPWTV